MASDSDSPALISADDLGAEGGCAEGGGVVEGVGDGGGRGLARAIGGLFFGLLVALDSDSPALIPADDLAADGGCAEGGGAVVGCVVEGGV